MIFSSAQFIFLFLPLVILGYYGLVLSERKVLAKVWLVVASLFFYGYWKIDYLAIILVSIVFNFLLVNQFAKHRGRLRKLCLQFGIAVNIGLLFYFKYMVFFANDVVGLFVADISMEQILLPLAISFFTFQQVAYLVDKYKFNAGEDTFLDYCLFVTFFPQLIAGPIVHHNEMMPQFADSKNLRVNWDNILRGLFVFSIGLFKKVVIADTLADWVDTGYANYLDLSTLDAWLLSFSYSFQLYYDFSGYADMAIGIGLMFNIRLPLNFLSPYRSTNIQDFWRRWHMTLSRWLRDYVYIPLGGNKLSKILTLRNVFMTAFVSGIWHGAGWTFLIWGTLHGVAMITHRLWKEAGFVMQKQLAWFLTFLFVNVTWVFFRSENLNQAGFVLHQMFAFTSFTIEFNYSSLIEIIKSNAIWLIELPVKNNFASFSTLLSCISLLFLLEFYKKDEKTLFVNNVIANKLYLTPFLLVISIWFMSVETVEKFIYFNF